MSQLISVCIAFLGRPAAEKRVAPCGGHGRCGPSRETCVCVVCVCVVLRTTLVLRTRVQAPAVVDANNCIGGLVNIFPF